MAVNIKLTFIILVCCSLTITVYSAECDDRFDALVLRIDALEKRDIVQQQEIIDLRGQLVQQKRRTSVLEAIVRMFTSSSALKTTTKLTTKDADTAERVQDHRINKIERDGGTSKIFRKDRSERPNRVRRAEIDMDVAFFATLTNHQTHVSANQAILFDHVVTNIGNAYQSHVGTFIAPVSGTYIFSVSILTGWDQSAEYAISKNGVTLSKLYCYAVKSHYDSSSQTIVIQLNQNDNIKIRNMQSDKLTHGQHYSTFAGYLLSQSYTPNAIIG